MSLKAGHYWVEKFSKGRSKIADDTQPDAEVAEIKVERLLFCEFLRTGKEVGQVYKCWWKIRREKFFLSGSNITCFMLYIHM